MLIKKNFFYSIVLVHASSVRTRDWTRTCSWTLNWTRTEPIDKVRVRFEFKYYGFGFGSSSGIMGSGSVRVRVQGSMNSNRTEPNLGTLHPMLATNKIFGIKSLPWLCHPLICLLSLSLISLIFWQILLVLK